MRCAARSSSLQLAAMLVCDPETQAVFREVRTGFCGSGRAPHQRANSCTCPQDMERILFDERQSVVFASGLDAKGEEKNQS